MNSSAPGPQASACTSRSETWRSRYEVGPVTNRLARHRVPSTVAVMAGVGAPAAQRR